MSAEERVPTKRPPGVSRRLSFKPDAAFEWGLWCRENDPARWAAISDRAKVAVHYYELARAIWMADDRVPTAPARESEGA